MERNMIKFESSFTYDSKPIKISFDVLLTPIMNEKNDHHLKRVRNVLEEIVELKRPKVIQAFQPSKFKPLF